MNEASCLPDDFDLKLPSDAMEIEKEMYQYLVKIINVPRPKVSVYAKVSNPVYKFILYYVFEVGYPQTEVCKHLGVCKATLWQMINELKEEVREYYKEAGLIND